MNTGEAVRLIGLLEEVADNDHSETLHAGIAAVLRHIRPCIPMDQAAAFDRYCAGGHYRDFLQRLEAGSEEIA